MNISTPGIPVTGGAITIPDKAVAKPGGLRHILELDGIRGIAILMVMIGHTLPKHGLDQLDMAGVDLFFVLSGFLITRILLGSREKPHFFTNFYIRRAFRIWPLYYLVLGLAFLTPLFPFSHSDWPAYRFLLYIQNFWSLDGAPAILRVSWSLAVEEQFYVVWPLVVWLARSPMRVAGIALGVVAITPLIRLAFTLHGTDPYIYTFARLDAISLGSLLAALSLSPVMTPQRWRTMLVWATGIGICLLPSVHWTLARKALKDTAFSLFFFAIVGAAFHWMNSPVLAVLRSAFLRFFGRISYAAYLVHLALLERLTWVPMILRWVIILGIATASWYLFESPVLRFKDRFTRTDAVGASKVNQAR